MTDAPTSTPRRVARKHRGQPTTDGAGVRMTRVIGTPQLDHVDPFLLLDEFRSDNPDDYIAGFPDHPHRGFETVTYMLAGAMKHGDNQGNTGLLGPGSVQWMTAGRGIVHSELPMQENGLMWGFQLWVNLPASDKMTAPRYQDIPAQAVPEVVLGDGASARVLCGELAGSTGPVQGVPTQPLYVDLTLAAGAVTELPVPAGHTAMAYVYEGQVQAGPEATPIERSELALLSDGDSVDLSSRQGARCLLIGARPLHEPVARYGPFVMNTREEIIQAVEDYQSGRF
jgi:redox-sensitive bicupin YhaK (pirin superfamily)